MQVQSPVLDALDDQVHYSNSDREYNWFRYSAAAFPALIFILLVSSALLCLTFWQGNTHLKEIRPGLPRLIEIPRGADDRVAGIPLYNRNMRIATFTIALIAILLILLVMYIKPPAGARKGAYMGLAALLLVAGVLGIIAFALDAGNVNDAVRCRDRKQGNVAFLVDLDVCDDYDTIAVTTTILAFLTGFFSLLTGIVLILAALKSGKEVKDEFGDAPRVRGVSKTTKEILLILIFTTLFVAILLCVFTVLLDEARDTFTMDDVYGSRALTNPRPGWPVRNTRLRIAAAGIVIGLAIFSLIPFRSRVIAYCCAFLLFLASPILLWAFALDVKEVDSARDLPCPDNYECKFHPYYATCFLDIFLALVLIFYVLLEFVARVYSEVTHR